MNANERTRAIEVSKRLVTALENGTFPQAVTVLQQNYGQHTITVLESAVVHLQRLFEQLDEFVADKRNLLCVLPVVCSIFLSALFLQSFTWYVILFVAPLHFFLVSFYVRASSAKTREALRERWHAVVLALCRTDSTAALRVLLPLWAKQWRIDSQLEGELSRLLQQVVLSPDAHLPLKPGQKEELRDALSAKFPQIVRSTRNQTDFTDTQTDILISLIQILSRSPLASNKAVLSRIADYPATFPNRALVRDAARVFVYGATDPVTAIAHTSPINYAQMVAPSHVQSVGQRGANP